MYVCMYQKYNAIIYVNIILICKSICSLFWRRNYHANVNKNENISQFANLLERSLYVWMCNCWKGFSTLTSAKSLLIFFCFWLLYFNWCIPQVTPPVLILIVLISYIIPLFQLTIFSSTRTQSLLLPPGMVRLSENFDAPVLSVVTSVQP
jgi:hypothetical protein